VRYWRYDGYACLLLCQRRDSYNPEGFLTRKGSGERGRDERRDTPETKTKKHVPGAK